MHDDELTPREREALDSLPRRAVPSPGMEDRIVSALRQRGLIGEKRRGVISIGPARLAAVAAAGLVLVAGSFAAGRLTVSPVDATTGESPSRASTKAERAASREEVPVSTAGKTAVAKDTPAEMPVMASAESSPVNSAAAGPFGSPEVSPAATVQWAGTFYLLALERLASVDTDPEGNEWGEARQGREVALRTLYAAADRISRMMPRDAVSRQLRFVIGDGGSAAADTTQKISTKTGWF